MVNAAPTLNAFSVDVEDYYQVLNFQKAIRRDQWRDYPSRVVPNTERILELLEEHSVRGTFFCLGCVADDHPELIRSIAKRGHEVASHGQTHTPIHHLTPTAFAAELRDSKSRLEDLSGRPVRGFRAPSFSITEKTSWALDALIEAGYEYDSSVFPVRHPDYGIPGSPLEIHQLKTPGGGTILEFPMTTARFLGTTVPVSGGGYFRLLPLSVTRWGLRQANHRGRPAVFYLHPWEIDPEQPNLRAKTSKIGAFRHYTGLNKTLSRLKVLLQSFSFASLETVLQGTGHLRVR